MSGRTSDERKRRVQRLKRLILYGLTAAFLLPTLLCILLAVRVHQLKQQVAAMTRQAQLSAEDPDTAQAGSDRQRNQSMGASGEDAEPLTEEDSIRAWEQQAQMDVTPQLEAHGIRKVYLTFDDGPSPYTEEILDILKEYHVKATFFVVGKGKEAYEAEYRRIVEEGHTLGMHSYSHVYREIYSSREAFIKDVNALQDYLYQVTGKYPDFYRFPGGSSNRVSSVQMTELQDYLEEIDVTWYDWNISSGDATGHLSSEQIIRNCSTGLEGYQEAVILLHDAADKRSTVEALPGLLERLLQMEDTVIVPITQDTIPIQHRTGRA